MTSIGKIAAGKTADLNLLSTAPKVSSDNVDFEQVLQNSCVGNSSEVDVKSTSLHDAKGEVGEQTAATVDATANRVSVKESSEQSDISEEQVVDTVNKAIKDAVEEVMGIDEETIEKVLAELGMIPVDLLQPENLQQFVLLVDGGQEPTDLLLNEDMMADFHALSVILQEIDLEQLTGMPVEEAMKVMQDAIQNLEVDVSDLQGSPELQEATDAPLQTEEATSAVKVIVTDQRNQPVEEKEVITSEDKTIVSKAISTTESADMSSSGEKEGSLSQDAEGLTGQQAAAETKQTVSEAPVTGGPIQPFAVEVAKETLSTPPMQQMTEIVKQIVEQIRVNLQVDTTTLEMHLNPESLGKVLLTVSTKAGVMTANFTVQTEEARLALESQMYTLRETLEQKELKVEAVEVTVSQFEFTQDGNTGEDQKNMEQGDGRSRRFQFVEEGDEPTGSAEEDAERVRRSVMRDNGSSIDFTA